MNEVEKLYENCGIKKITDNAALQRYDGTTQELSKTDYPPFTAEKQLEIIKFLGKLDGKFEITCTYNKEKFIFHFYFNRKTDKNPDPKYMYSCLLDNDFSILIAKQINNLWQDLTEEEKEQIKELLNG